MTSNVSLVESESCAPLIQFGKRTHGLESDKQVMYLNCFKCRIIIFRSQMLHAGDPARCRITLSPVLGKMVDSSDST